VIDSNRGQIQICEVLGTYLKNSTLKYQKQQKLEVIHIEQNYNECGSFLFMKYVGPTLPNCRIDPTENSDIFSSVTTDYKPNSCSQSQSMLTNAARTFPPLRLAVSDKYRPAKNGTYSTGEDLSMLLADGTNPSGIRNVN